MHHGGHAVSPENVLADLASRFVVDRPHPLAADDEAAKFVRDCQRVAVAAIAQPELALVVDAPDLIGRGYQALACQTRHVTSPLSTRLDQTVLRQHLADRAGRWKWPAQAPLQYLLELPRAPRRMEPTLYQQYLSELGRGLVGDQLPRSRLIGETGRPQLS